MRASRLVVLLFLSLPFAFGCAPLDSKVTGLRTCERANDCRANEQCTQSSGYCVAPGRCALDEDCIADYECIKTQCVPEGTDPVDVPDVPDPNMDGGMVDPTPTPVYQGALDISASEDCVTIRGWACIVDSPTAVTVDINDSAFGTFYGQVTANEQLNSPEMVAACGGGGHGFTFRLPNNLREQRTFFAASIPAAGFQLAGGPIDMDCAPFVPDCAGAGQPCCSGWLCNDGLACNDSNVCQACGERGQICCRGDNCDGGLMCNGSGFCQDPPMACGARGEACCAGNACDGSLTCQSGVCNNPPITCGANNQMCCSGNSCNSGLSCQSGFCRTPPPCGGNNQMCCSGNSCNSGLACQSGVCRTPPPPCGGNNQMCCSGNSCNSGLACQSGVCRTPPPPCGGLNQACCSGNTCDGVLTCQSGSCRTPQPPCGARDQICCSGNTCNGSLTCQSGICDDPPVPVNLRGNFDGPPPGGDACDTLYGWACDLNDSEQLDVNIRLEGTSRSFWRLANEQRNDVASVCNGRVMHGFSFPVPDDLKNGTLKRLHAIAYTQDRGASRDLGTINITCQAPPEPIPNCPAGTTQITGVYSNGAYHIDNQSIALGATRRYCAHITNGVSKLWFATLDKGAGNCSNVSLKVTTPWGAVYDADTSTISGTRVIENIRIPIRDTQYRAGNYIIEVGSLFNSCTNGTSRVDVGYCPDCTE